MISNEKNLLAIKIMEVLLEAYPNGITIQNVRDVFGFIESQLDNVTLIDMKPSDIIF